MRILLQLRPYIQGKLLVHYKRTSGSEKVRKRTEKESSKRIESVGGRAAGESGGRERRGSLGWSFGKQVRSTVGWDISGGRWHCGVEGRRSVGRAADEVLVGSAGVPLTIAGTTGRGSVSTDGGDLVGTAVGFVSPPVTTGTGGGETLRVGVGAGTGGLGDVSTDGCLAIGTAVFVTFPLAALAISPGAPLAFGPSFPRGFAFDEDLPGH